MMGQLDCSGIAPALVLEASHSMMKGCVKSGVTNTDAEVIESWRRRRLLVCCYYNKMRDIDPF